MNPGMKFTPVKGDSPQHLFIRSAFQVYSKKPYQSANLVALRSVSCPDWPEPPGPLYTGPTPTAAPCSQDKLAPPACASPTRFQGTRQRTSKGRQGPDEALL